MSNKPRETQYGEFRLITEWQRGNRRRFKPAAVPSIAAFLLMVGRRYQAAADGLRNYVVQGTVPAAPGLLKHNEVARDVCANLLRILGDTFPAEEWYAAVADVCALMGIVPKSEPLDDVPAEQFAKFVEELSRECDPITSERLVHAGAGDSPFGGLAGARPADADERDSAPPVGHDTGDERPELHLHGRAERDAASAPRKRHRKRADQ